MITLNKVIEEELKDPEFRVFYEEEQIKNQVAKLIVELRQKEGLTQEELAQAAHTTQPVIARLEKGTDKRTPSLNLLNKIAHSLGRELFIGFTVLKPAKP